MDTDVVILAGGNSSRMRKPKLFLEFTNKITFLEQLVKVYRDFLCNKIVLVLNNEFMKTYMETYDEDFKANVQIVPNTKPELGRFYSLRLGLNAIPGSRYCFMQNIDNPFTDKNTLNVLYNSKDDYSFISPVYNYRAGHPILIPYNILEKIRNEYNTDINIKEYLAQYKKISVNVINEKVLVNVNTPEEYERYFK